MRLMGVLKRPNTKISYSLLILMIFFEAIFLSLAYWQYNRMNNKEDTFKAFEGKFTQEAISFTHIEKPEDWQIVKITGVFDYENERLLQNRRYKSYVGYRIITPLLTDDGHYVMIDRGWIPKTYDKAPPADLQDKKGFVTLTGVVRHIPPKKSFIEGPLYGITKRVIKRIDGDAFPMNFKYKDMLIQASSSDNQNIKSFIEKPKTGARHSEYMLTWLCLALILPTLYISLLYTRNEPEEL
jgi:surfeit locus 1 family protein